MCVAITLEGNEGGGEECRGTCGVGGEGKVMGMEEG